MTSRAIGMMAATLASAATLGAAALVIRALRRSPQERPPNVFVTRMNGDNLRYDFNTDGEAAAYFERIMNNAEAARDDGVSDVWLTTSSEETHRDIPSGLIVNDRGFAAESARHAVVKGDELGHIWVPFDDEGEARAFFDRVNEGGRANLLVKDGRVVAPAGEEAPVENHDLYVLVTEGHGVVVATGYWSLHDALRAANEAAASAPSYVLRDPKGNRIAGAT